jgi:hypothetical protein
MSNMMKILQNTLSVNKTGLTRCQTIVGAFASDLPGQVAAVSRCRQQP